MLRFSLSIVLLLSCLYSFSQQLITNDSLLWDHIAQQKLKFLYEQPMLTKVKQQDFNIGEAELLFQNKQGEYRRAKDAYNQSLVNFTANGISQIDSFLISGQFKFNRIWEDSLANTLQGLDDDLSPYYYFVEKPGKYERQNFNGHVQVRYSGISRYFQPGLKFDYGIHWTTRSVDPRPNVASVAIKFNPYISSEIGNSLLSAGLIYGYGDEETEISYKNRMYNTSTLYPDRIYYTNQGFGYITQKDSSAMRKFDQYIGANLAYNLQGQHYNLLSSLNIERKITNSTFDQKLRKQYFKRSEFTLNSILSRTQFSWQQAADKQQLLDLAIVHHKGLDYNYNLRSANYIVKNTTVNFNYANQRKYWTFGFGTLWTSMDKQDAAAAHHHSYQQVQVQAQIKRVFPVGKNYLEAEFIPSYTFSVANKLSVPSTQVNVFTQSIVYPDYDYFNLEPIGLDLNLGYILPKSLNMRGSKIFLRNQFLTLMKDQKTTLMSQAKENYHRWQLQIGAMVSL